MSATRGVAVGDASPGTAFEFASGAGTTGVGAAGVAVAGAAADPAFTGAAGLCCGSVASASDSGSGAATEGGIIDTLRPDAGVECSIGARAVAGPGVGVATAATDPAARGTCARGVAVVAAESGDGDPVAAAGVVDAAATSANMHRLPTGTPSMPRIEPHWMSTFWPRASWAAAAV